MKKTYEAPSVEKIAFQYRDQVVAASGINTHKCEVHYSHSNDVVNCMDNKNVVSASEL